MSAPDKESPAWSVLPSTEELLARHRQVVARTPSMTATSSTGCTRSASLEHKKETAGFGQELAAHYVLLRQQRAYLEVREDARSALGSVSSAPLHSAAPHLCMPAQAERVSCMISVSPSLARPSWIILLLRNNRHGHE